MFQIQDTLVTLDIVERFFCCDLEKCLGACCIEGDAGAPVTPEEVGKIEAELPEVKPLMLPRAVEEVESSGVAYTDQEGDLVTTILDGKNCAFTCYGPNGLCLCALERLYREGKTTFKKPASCSLYPLRIKKYPSFTAVNYHRWDICRDAEKLGRAKGIRLYQFLREPLIEHFGQAWYDELAAACDLYIKEYLS